MLNKTLSNTDLVDFDYFSSDLTITIDNEKERLLYLNHIEPELKDSEKHDHEKIISLWIKAKRNKSSEISPGRVFNAGFRLIFFIFISTGFLTGLGAAISYLSYSGTLPINITIYIFVFVFSQIFFQLLTLITLISSRFSFLSDFFHTPYSIALIVIKKAASSGLGKIPAEKREGIASSIGKIKINREKYGEIYFWAIFKIFQFTGLMFSTGVLIATLFKVITSDLAFGWQTTIQTAPEKIYDIVSIFSMPWSWLVPDHIAYPALKNIEGSQILLKNSIVNLVSSDMAAWWPFLCLAVIFYTIIPRLLLIITGIFFERKAIKKTILNNSKADNLIQMLTSTYMVFEKNNANSESVLKTDYSFIQGQNKGMLPAGDKVFVLVPEDIFSKEFSEYIGEKIKKKFGIINKTLSITGDAEEDHELIKSMVAKFNPSSSPVILVVYEAWLPPIKENIDYIKEIRKLAGKNISIIVLLTGKAIPGNVEYSEVQNKDFKIWNWKIQAMGDKNIFCEPDKK